MSYKIVRHSAENQSPVVVDSVIQSNLVDFNISPMGDATNLRESYISLKLSIADVLDGGNTILRGDTTPIANVVVGMSEYGDSNHSPSSVCSIVKNAYLEFSGKGKVEDLRRCNLIKNVMKNYLSSQEDQASDRETPFSKSENVNDINVPCVTRVLNRQGTEPSRRRVFEIMIKMSELFDSCNILGSINQEEVGNIRIHLELNLNTISLIEQYGNANGINTDASYWTQGARGTLTPYGAAVPIKTVTTIAEYRNIGESPFHVGMPIHLGGVKNGGGANSQNIDTTITGIDWVGVAGAGGYKLVITCADNVFAANDVITVPTIRGRANVPVYTLDRPELVMRYDNVAETNIKQGIEYTTYSIEEDIMNGVQNFNHIYQLEPECSAVLVAFDNTNENPYSSVSNINTISSYRFRVNNQELTDDVVRIDQSIDIESIDTLFKSMGLEVKNLGGIARNPKQNGFTLNLNGQDTTVTNQIIGVPVSLTNEPKLLHVEINNNVALNNNHITLIKLLNKKI